MSIDLDDVPAACQEAVVTTLAAVGVRRAHLGVGFVGADEIRALNLQHRAIDEPTDVLSFPIDAIGGGAGEQPLELGDVVICVEQTADVTEAVVHGVLHLCGFDHEADDGEMLALQGRVLEQLGHVVSSPMGSEDEG